MEMSELYDVSNNSDKSSLVSRTSTVNLEDTRFSLDGVIAEMIIEVDENTESMEQATTKPFMAGSMTSDISQEVATPNTGVSKEQFVQNLGLSLASADQTLDTSTASESGALRNSTVDSDCEVLEQVNSSEVQLIKPKRVYRKRRYFPERKSERVSGRDRVKMETLAHENIQPSVVLEKLALPVLDGIRKCSLSSTNAVRLSSIDYVCKQIRKVDMDVLSTVFYLLYAKMAPSDIDSARYQILHFCGFSSKERPLKYARLKQVLDMYQESIVRKICCLFGIKLGTKAEMIKNISQFLSKPTKKLDPSIDISYQPVVSLVNLDADAVARICEELVKKSKVTKATKKKSENLKASSSIKVENSKMPVKKKTAISVQQLRKQDKKVKGFYKKSNLKLIEKKKKKGKEIVVEVKKKKVKSAATVVLKTKTEPLKKTPQTKKPEPLKKTPQAKKPEPLKKMPNTKKQEPLKKTPQTKKPESLKKLPQTKQPELTLSRRKQKCPQKAVVKIEEEDVTDESSIQKSAVLVPAASEKILASSMENVSGMERRAADKRRKPSLYGEWLGDEDISKQVKKSTVEVIEEKDLPIEDDASSDHSLSETISADDMDMIEDESLDMEESVEAKESDKSSDEGEHRCVEMHYISKAAEEGSDIEIIEDDNNSSPVQQKENPKGVKLGNFPQIVKSLNSITNCILQKLHVFLYGTNLQPEVMKRNILNFRGFPFDKDSEEWQQKHFILSLSSSNNLLEMIEVLHVKADSECSTDLVDTLMNFLHCPRKEWMDESSSITEESPVDKSKKYSKKKPIPNVKIDIQGLLQKKRKADDSTPKKTKKVLLDIDDVKKMELQIAREQRTKQLVKECKARSSGVPYKHSGAHTSPPNVRDGATAATQGVRLADNSHVKFMIVALTYSDLEVLHHVIFLHNAVKSKIRRNILEFQGFDFDQSSPRYKVRKTILQRLGYRSVKRIAFILGIAPLETTTPMPKLIDQIMRFLVEPSRTSKITLTELSRSFLQDHLGDIDKKAVFTNIPQLADVMMEELGDLSTPGGYIVKSIGNLNAKGDASNPTMKAIPVAELIPSGSLRKHYSYSKLNAKEKLHQALMSAKQRNLAIGNIIRYENANIRIMAPPAPRSTTASSTPTSSQKLQSSGAPTANQPKLPPGQAFLIDPSKWLVLSKSTEKSQTSSVPATSVVKLAKPEIMIEGMSPLKFPLVTKLKNPSNINATQVSPKQIANSSNLVTLQPKQTVIFQNPDSQKALVPQNTATSSQSASQLQKTLPTLKLVKPGQNQTQQQPFLFIQKSSGVQPFVQTLSNLQQTASHKSAVDPMNGQTSGISSLSLNTFPSKVVTSGGQRIIVQNVSPGIPEPPRLIQGEPTPLVSEQEKQASGLTKMLLKIPQTMNAPVSSASQEIVYHQKKMNGEEEKITLLQLPPGHPLLNPLKGTAMQSTEVAFSECGVGSQSVSTAASLKPRNACDNTTLCESGYRPPFSAGIVRSETSQQRDGNQSGMQLQRSLVDPSDDMLFERIQDIIHSANLEDLTLKKINEKLLNEFPCLNLAVRRPFIKETVKNIICGITS